MAKVSNYDELRAVLLGESREDIPTVLQCIRGALKPHASTLQECGDTVEDAVQCLARTLAERVKKAQRINDVPAYIRVSAAHYVKNCERKQRKRESHGHVAESPEDNASAFKYGKNAARPRRVFIDATLFARMIARNPYYIAAKHTELIERITWAQAAGEAAIEHLLHHDGAAMRAMRERDLSALHRQLSQRAIAAAFDSTNIAQREQSARLQVEREICRFVADYIEGLPDARRQAFWRSFVVQREAVAIACKYPLSQVRLTAIADERARFRAYVRKVMHGGKFHLSEGEVAVLTGVRSPAQVMYSAARKWRAQFKKIFGET